MPSIIGGIRTSSVMLIGTATLGALIGAGGLGTFILLGIDRNNSASSSSGPLRRPYWLSSSALLSKFLEKRSLKVIGLSFVTALALLVLSTVNIGGLSGNTLIAAGNWGRNRKF